MKILSLQELNRLSPDAFKIAPKIPLILAADQIRSGHNVGSLFRIGDAFGIEQIILGGYTVQPPHPEIQKTAIGASETVAWCHFERLEEFLMQMKLQGYIIIGIEQTSDSISLNNFEVEVDKAYILIFGNEVNGISESVLQCVDYCIEIPQRGTKHSINVSVAAGIVTWHFAKRFL